MNFAHTFGLMSNLLRRSPKSSKAIIDSRFQDSLPQYGSIYEPVNMSGLSGKSQAGLWAKGHRFKHSKVATSDSDSKPQTVVWLKSTGTLTATSNHQLPAIVTVVHVRNRHRHVLRLVYASPVQSSVQVTGFQTRRCVVGNNRQQHTIRAEPSRIKSNRTK